MSVARELYQLQAIDLEIDAGERVLKQKTGQLGESEALLGARAKLDSAQKSLGDLKHRQRSSEWEIDDLTGKINIIDEKLYGGRIRNPKELTDLQREGNILKARRSQLETGVLELMEQVESAEAALTEESHRCQHLEQEWQGQQRHLATEIEKLKARLAELKNERQLQMERTDPGTIGLYDKLRRQKGQALARIEQGICCGCRLSLSSHEIQQARSGNLVQCSSCGRILYLP